MKTKIILVMLVVSLVITLIMNMLLTGCSNYLEQEENKQALLAVAENYKSLYEAEKENVSVLREKEKELKMQVQELTTYVNSMWSYINWLDEIMENKYNFEAHNELYMKTHGGE